MSNLSDREQLEHFLELLKESSPCGSSIKIPQDAIKALLRESNEFKNLLDKQTENFEVALKDAHEYKLAAEAEAQRADELQIKYESALCLMAENAKKLERMSKSAGVENLLEKLPDMLAEAQVETIPNSAIYDVDVRKLAELIHASVGKGEL